MKTTLDVEAKNELTLTKSDILPLVSKSNEETELYLDILDDMEKQVAARIKDIACVNIVKIGSFIPNMNKIGIMEDAYLTNKRRNEMSREEFMEYCYKRKVARNNLKFQFRCKRVIVSKFTRLHKKLALKYMDKYRDDELSYKLSIWFLSRIQSYHSFEYYCNNAEELNTRKYDRDFTYRFDWND